MEADGIITKNQLLTLSTIVRVGNSAYQDLLKSDTALFTHPYSLSLGGRIRTILVQMQCEIESHNPNFPFRLYQRNFAYNQCIPELRSKGCILHIARSMAPDVLPYESRYKIELSNNNSLLCRQMRLSADESKICEEVPFYGILAFGDRPLPFAIIQFPEPGFHGIADSIRVPTFGTEESETFERKKAALKQKFLSQREQLGF